MCKLERGGKSPAQRPACKGPGGASQLRHDACRIALTPVEKEDGEGYQLLRIAFFYKGGQVTGENGAL